MTPEVIQAIIYLYLLGMIVVIAGIVVYRWRRGYHRLNLLPDGAVLAYIAPYAGVLALHRHDGGEFNSWHWLGSAAVAFTALMLLMGQTRALRMAVRFWVRGRPWNESITLAREIVKEANESIGKKTPRNP